MSFERVLVPAGNLLGAEHDGFAIAQARLGPGRIHHCMRTIGQCELALELMTRRAIDRRAFGRRLADYANNQDEIALSRIEIDQARLLCLQAAWRMDTQGNQAARVDVSAIKLVAARLQTRVLDRAIQMFGAMGLSNDTPLAYLWTWGRALRFIDGPDESPSAGRLAPRDPQARDPGRRTMSTARRAGRAAATLPILLAGLAGCLPGETLPPLTRPENRPRTVIDRALSECHDKTAKAETECVKAVLGAGQITLPGLIGLMPNCRPGHPCTYDYTTEDRIGFFAVYATHVVYHWRVTFDLTRQPKTPGDIPVKVEVL